VAIEPPFLFLSRVNADVKREKENSMTLAMTIDTLDGMDEGIAKLYVEKDGKFTLDVDGHDKNDQPDNRIPKHRLDQEIEKRKASDATLKEVADGFINDVPEAMRDIVPDLPPAQQIKWIQNANKKGLFDSPQAQSGPDSKRPGSKKAENFDGLSPQAKMAQGYKTK
jgi:hypothetical protein